MTEEEIVEDMRRILKSDKNSGDFPGWKDGSGRDALVLTLPLDVLAETVGTARSVIRCVRGSPDRDCSATLIATIQGRDLHLWRMDWKPQYSHTNRCGPRSLRGVISETGIHEFERNAALGLRRMQADNLPLCIPVDDVPHDFDAFIRYVCQSLKIAPLDQILGPPWSPSLL
jgi:hypothetical protein